MILTEFKKNRCKNLQSELTKKSLLVEKISEKHKTVISLDNNIKIGSEKLCIISGPCSVESEQQILQTAEFVKNSGGTVLRGGCFKPRTSPYDFQGLGLEGLKLLKAAGKIYNLPVITEVMDTKDIQLVEEYADIIQVGSRNALNYSLLKELGKINKPILLKRGLMMTVKEFIMSAEYILSEGNSNVILCERGIRTFETETRNTLDISVIPILKENTHLPVIVDPSHAAGKRSLIQSLSLASVAAGADGLMIESHISPETALCDGQQSLNSNEFQNLVKSILPIAKAIGRKI